MTTKPYVRKGKDSTVKQDVYELLHEDSKIKAINICEKLGLPYKPNRRYVWKLCSRYRNEVRNRRVSNLSNLVSVSAHFGWFWVYCPRGSRVGLEERALEGGWVRTRSKNRFLLWVDPKKEFGSVRWFETDRVSLRVRVPVNYGRAKTLFTLAFGRVLPVDVLVHCSDCIRFKGADHVFDVGVRLKPFRIKMFSKSNGVEIFCDRSHPGKLEVRAFYPDYGEKAEATIQRFNELFERVLGKGENQNKRGKGRGEFEFYG